MTSSMCNKDLAISKLEEFKTAIKDKDMLATFLAYDLDHFFEQYPNFDPWLYTLLHVDTFARLEELNKGLKNEENIQSYF